MVVIQRNTPVSDGEGGYTDAWASNPSGGVWAKVRASGGSERFFAERTAPGNLFKITIRFVDDGNGAPFYRIGDRVIHNGRELGVLSVVDVEDARQYIEIMAMENKAS